MGTLKAKKIKIVQDSQRRLKRLDTSELINMKDLHLLINQGHIVTVTHKYTGKDITSKVLSKLCFVPPGVGRDKP